MMEYEIREGLENMDFDAVTAMLQPAFWWQGYDDAPTLIRRAAKNSGLVVGAFKPDGTQAGYARVVTDFVRTAYLADVIVREDCRRQGVASAMVQHILRADALSTVKKFFLITRDAHALYLGNGFAVTDRGGDYMEWFRPEI